MDRNKYEAPFCEFFSVGPQKVICESGPQNSGNETVGETEGTW